MNTPRPPVRVELHAEWPGGHADQFIEIPRSEWEAMTPQQRADLCDRDAVAFLIDQNVASGYTVLGDDAGSEQDDQQPAPTADTTSLRQQIALALTGNMLHVLSNPDVMRGQLDAADRIITAVVAPLLAERDDLEREVARLRRDGSPGVMHKVDAAFHKIVLQERDLARAAEDRLRAERERGDREHEEAMRVATAAMQHLQKRCTTLVVTRNRLRAERDAAQEEAEHLRALLADQQKPRIPDEATSRTHPEQRDDLAGLAAYHQQPGHQPPRD